jgi:hypothetical protein
MKTYLAFTIQVYKSMTPQGTLSDYVEVQVVADSEKEALEKAKKVYVRAEYTYRVKAVTEYQYVENDKK